MRTKIRRATIDIVPTSFRKVKYASPAGTDSIYPPSSSAEVQFSLIL
jgi:hypothetical protein